MPWSPRRGRDPDPKVRDLKRRFWAISRRHGRATKLRQFWRTARVPALIAGGFLVLHLALNGLPSWLPTASEPAPYQCRFNTYNCSDFRTHAEAQALFEACGGRDNDVHRLDRDRDGIACEWSPRR